MTRASTQRALKQLPVSWAIAFLVLIVLYAVLQPVANARMGWHLPSLARLLGEPEPKAQQADRKADSGRQQSDNSADQSSPTATTKSDKDTPKPDRQSSQPDQPNGTEPDAIDSTTSHASATESAAQSNTTDSKASQSTAPESPTSGRASKRSQVAKSEEGTRGPAKEARAGDDGTLLYGLLRDIGGKRYVSPAGLQYNPGSEEGHRLKHVERHLEDMPDRPGKHGVFDGDMAQVLRWIDDAFTRGKQGAKGVRKSEEDGRTVFEVPFTQPIGFIGGRDGKRSGNPPAKRLRLVVEGNKVITAFPF